MLTKRILTIALALVCMMALALPVSAAQVDCDDVYCFGVADFSQEEGELTGICITGLPHGDTGVVLLGNRVLRPGDILAADQVERMTFRPVRTQEDTQAVVEYLPIYENRVAPETSMTISICGKEDKAPVVKDQRFETYKNLPKEGKLTVSDPEGSELTFTVIRQPKRGEVIIRSDGSFLYTPNKNKVGTDSFIFTATDSAGNVSKEATVTIQLMKPTAKEYADTLGKGYRFEAEWLKNTGLFTGESVNGDSCFQAHKHFSRGEFLAMAVKLLELPIQEDGAQLEVVQSAPSWLRPYVAAALRSGLLDGVDFSASGYFEGNITGPEAALMVQNVLDLRISTAAALTPEGETAQPSQIALACLAENGIPLPTRELTRAEVAVMLYGVKGLAQDAPGMQIIRTQG